MAEFNKNGIPWLRRHDALKHHLGISPSESLRRGDCELCGRYANMVRHHLQPVSVTCAAQLDAVRLDGGDKAARREKRRLRGCPESGSVAELCLPCHEELHRQIGRDELCSVYNTVAALREHPGLAAYLAGLGERKTR